MDAKKTCELPARLEGVRGRFERWRRGRKGGARIPETLWAAAVKVAGAYGVNRTAKALRVNYYALKKRVEHQAVAADGVNAAAIAQSTSADVGAATFLELAPCGPAASDFIDEVRVGFGGCTLELDRGGGSKMRVDLRGFSATEVAAIGRGLWRGGP